MRILAWIGGTVGAAAIAGLAIGVIAGVPVIDSVDRVFSSNAFCAETCHVMTDTVAAELKTSVHGSNEFGVIPKCRDCHISDTLFGAMVDHVKGLHDLYSFTIKGINTPEKFEKIRFDAANTARMHMYESDSAGCRTCHVMEKIAPKKKRGQRQHAEAREKDITCIVCHYDLVHKEVELSEEFDAIVGQY